MNETNKIRAEVALNYVRSKFDLAVENTVLNYPITNNSVLVSVGIEERVVLSEAEFEHNTQLSGLMQSAITDMYRTILETIIRDFIKLDPDMKLEDFL